jgi:hypothetical protein
MYHSEPYITLNLCRALQDAQRKIGELSMQVDILEALLEKKGHLEVLAVQLADLVPTPRSAAACPIGRPASSTSRTPRSSNSPGYFLDFDMIVENLLSPGQRPGIEVSVETGLAHSAQFHP